MSKATNKFLLDMKKRVEEMDDSEFQQLKDAIHTKVSEKDINLAKEYSRYWFEIESFDYMFDR